MKKFESKKQIKGRVYSRSTLIILLVVIILLIRGVFTLYLRYRESVIMRADAEQRLGELRERESSLGSEIDKLNRDGGIEAEIRQKFNVVKPGEHVVIIVPEAEATTTAENKGFFENLWHKFVR